MAEKPHLRILSNKDVEDIVNSRYTPGLISMLHPIEMNLDRDTLLAEVEQSLAEIRNNRREVAESAEDARIGNLVEQQRVDFIGWLHTQPALVFIALYPANEDGFDADEFVPQQIIEDDFGTD